VDEAYHEYVEDGAYASMIDLVRQGQNIIVTRTFSKIFGLAGLRIGYGIAPPGIIEKLNKLSRNFAPVAWLSLQAAIASYQDRAFIQTIKKKERANATVPVSRTGKNGNLVCSLSYKFCPFQDRSGCSRDGESTRAPKNPRPPVRFSRQPVDTGQLRNKGRIAGLSLFLR
jgi:histidinol-phosphate/aromatic aminotransferase/cobyric acid decarboxylase-like protein